MPRTRSGVSTARKLPVKLSWSLLIDQVLSIYTFFVHLSPVFRISNPFSRFSDESVAHESGLRCLTEGPDGADMEAVVEAEGAAVAVGTGDATPGMTY